MEPQTIIFPILALVSSAFVWTMGGYFKDWRSNHDNPDWEGFNKTSLKNDLILGAVLGVGTVVYTIFTDGDFAPISTAQDFLVAVGAGFTIVALVDKFIVGGLFKK